MHPVLVQIGSLVIPSYGATAALGVLLALGLVPWTTRQNKLDPRHGWNMLVLAVFASLAVSRLVLILVNLSDIRRHPSWLLAIAMVHHPLLAAAGIAAGSAAVLVYSRWAKLPLAAVVDALAAPVSIGMAAEQLGALLAGSGYGSETTGTWAVTYSSPLAARWSGTPIGVPLYPVQAYAAIGAILIAATLCIAMRRKRRPGDIAGIWLIATGALLAFTEMFRDWEGRGVLFHGYADLPQLVGLGLVILGGATLLDWHAHTPVAEKVGDV